MNTSRTSISIVVADDHLFALQGVTGALAGHPDLNVVAACTDVLTALQAIQDLLPEITVLALTMRGADGLDLLSTLSMKGCATKVVVLATAATDSQIVAAILAGARGFLFKDAGPDALVRCIRKVAAGQRPFTAEILEALSNCTGYFSSANEHRSKRLSVREREVAILASEGLSNKGIARQLALADGTVKIHLHNIYNKLEVANRTALAALIISRWDTSSVKRVIEGSIGGAAVDSLNTDEKKGMNIPSSHQM
jgi:two-component system, NarL family, nitrate/nitrite response regulator NarL